MLFVLIGALLRQGPFHFETAQQISGARKLANFSGLPGAAIAGHPRNSSSFRLVTEW